MRKYIQRRLDQNSEHQAEVAATNAFNSVLGTDYILFDVLVDEYTGRNPVPRSKVTLLLRGELASEHPKKPKYIQVQKLFDEQFALMQAKTQTAAADELHKNIRSVFILALLIIGAAVWWGVSSYRHHQDDLSQKAYVQKQHTPTVYNGELFNVKLPCLPVKADYAKDIGLDEQVTCSSIVGNYQVSANKSPGYDYNSPINEGTDEEGTTISNVRPSKTTIQGNPAYTVIFNTQERDYNNGGYNYFKHIFTRVMNEGTMYIISGTYKIDAGDVELQEYGSVIDTLVF